MKGKVTKSEELAAFNRLTNGRRRKMMWSKFNKRARAEMRRQYINNN